MTLLGAGAAMAVSAGGYTPAQQDCTPTADANNTATNPPTDNHQPGCHNFKVNVGSDDGSTRFAEVGLDQLPDGYSDTGALLFGIGTPGSPNFPHSGCASVNTDGTGGGTGVGCGSNTSGVGGALTFDIYNPGATTFTPAGMSTDGSVLTNAVQNGLTYYMGADDNLDAGEHDGVDGNYGTDGAENGPSDGGAVTIHVSPSQAGTTPDQTNPVPVA